MKLYVPAIIIGLVGGMLDEFTDLYKIWCFTMGVAAFILFLLIRSILITARIFRQTKGKRKIWMAQNNNVIKTE